ncbi:unnamed protein product [Caenorhabditis angaria]|uniref:IF140/IFT172/WDR19 TPR domain-containing protein n=1 Tax=Caenorhabditis angaria TaxID=860376 RepID=A0A9P1IN09_9PELO|nr:unnamed protein product [Caenorhabditis angaria]
MLFFRWVQAWKICEFSNDLSHWNMFAHACLLDSDVLMAIRIFRHIGDVAMVNALEQLEHLEEKNLLSAQVAIILGRYDEAEQLFMLSSRPNEALNMRRDLLEWPKALVLAEKMAPEEIPYISKEYAQQLELMGDHANALDNYEKGLLDNNLVENQEHNEICQSGIARMSIKTGDLRRGIQLAKSLEGRVVKRDCAIILEQLKQYTEAAQLYEIGLFFDRAAAVCLKANAWGKVADLLDKVKSPKIHIQYGKIMENEKKFKMAAVCYERGRDYDNLVRILLDPLNMPEEAVRVVRESRSIEGAKLVAKFFSRLGDHSSAIQFLVMSQCIQEAFDLAERNDSMADYATAIEQHGTAEQANELAEYFVSIADHFNAARFHIKGGQFQTAMILLLRLGERQEAIELSVDCAIKSNDKEILNNVTQFLTGQIDGIPKDPTHLFRLYVGLGMVKEAAKTAVIVSQAHQSRGSYRIARDVLFHMYMKLEEGQLKIPSEMHRNMTIIHSYIIIKPLIARKEHLKAARMLIRTCDNISKFPTHVVQILTSTVVICTQAGLRKSAHKYASALMNPEYRPKIHTKYKKKIEDIVRKSGKEDDPQEDKSMCPFCNYLIEETILTCSQCKNNLPYCILTGRHLISSDFALCTTCQMPGYFSEFKKLSALGLKCYMCNGETGDVIPGDSKSYFDKFAEQT